MLSVKELRALIVRLDAAELHQQFGPFALVLRPSESPDGHALEFYQQRTAVAEKQPELVHNVLELIVRFDDLLVATLPPLTSEDELSVGRAPDCEVSLEHASVSKRHAVLHWKGGVCTLRDAGSTNGTFLNDSRLQSGNEIALRDGDVLSFGEVHFWFLSIKTLYSRLSAAARGPLGATGR